MWRLLDGFHAFAEILRKVIPTPPNIHKELIKNALLPFLKPAKTGCCTQVFEGRRPASGKEAYTEGRACRLILGLSGKGKFLIIEGGKKSTFEISRGDSVFLAPNTWISCIPEITYKSMGIIFGQAFLRVTITRRRVRAGVVTLEYLAKWQNNRRPHKQEVLTLQLLQHSSPPRLEDSYAKQLLSLVLNLTWDALLEDRVYKPAQGQELWQAMCEYINEHWSESSLSREQLADHFHVHPNHISRIFKSFGNTKYISFLNEIRLSRSMELLESSSYNVTDIAALCGYTDPQYYIRCFRERYATTPGEFRRTQLSRLK